MDAGISRRGIVLAPHPPNKRFKLKSAPKRCADKDEKNAVLCRSPSPRDTAEDIPTYLPFRSRTRTILRPRHTAQLARSLSQSSSCCRKRAHATQQASMSSFACFARPPTARAIAKVPLNPYRRATPVPAGRLPAVRHLTSWICPRLQDFQKARGGHWQPGTVVLFAWVALGSTTSPTSPIYLGFCSTCLIKSSRPTRRCKRSIKRPSSKFVVCYSDSPCRSSRQRTSL